MRLAIPNDAAPSYYEELERLIEAIERADREAARDLRQAANGYRAGSGSVVSRARLYAAALRLKGANDDQE